MNGLLVIAEMTLYESRQRRILLATLLCGLAFLILFGTGFFFVHRDIEAHTAENLIERAVLLNFFIMAGLYAVNFLTVMTAVLMPVDTLSGEIASGVMQTIASKPIPRR